MIDWNKCAEAFDDAAAEKLCKSRGYSPDIVAYLREKRLVGLYGSNIAFVTTGGAHYKVTSGGWRYSEGAKPSPFILGGIEEGAHVNCFESQWCAISYADLSGDRENIVASRGASNSKLIADAIGANFTGVIYLWPQNDVPGRKWAEDIRKLLPNVQVRLCHTPEQFKDINEFIKSGATSGSLLNLYIDAKEFPCQQPQNTTKLTSNTYSPSPESGTSPIRKPETPSLVGTTPETEQSLRSAGSPKGLPLSPTLTESSPREVVPIAEKATQPASTSIITKEEKNLKFPAHVASNAQSEKLPSVSLSAQTVIEKGITQTALDHGPIVDLSQALNAMESFFRKYVKFPEEWHYTVVSLWSAYTWIWKAFYRTPYLLVRGPEENCGKTRVLDCLLALAPTVFSGQIVAGASESSLYHEIHNSRPVLLLDEIDESFANGMDDPIVKVINAGYRKGGTVTRWNIRTGKPDIYDIFCPKAFAGIGNNIKATVASRCIHIHMARQGTEDMAAPFREDKAPMEVFQIRTFLAQWALAAEGELRGKEPHIPKELANDGRKAEITEPLLAVADMAGPEWAGKAREDLVCAFDQPKDDSEGTKLLRSIKRIFDTCNLECITSHSLIEYLVKDDEGPWATWWERDLSGGRWHGAAHKIGKMLRPYRIHSKNVRVGEGPENQGKGYVRADFASTWRQYIPSTTKAENMELQLI